MVRKFLYAIAGAVVLVLLGALALRLFPDQLMRLAFVPGRAFEAQPALPANAYAASDMWLARPDDGGDAARFVPAAPTPAPTPALSPALATSAAPAAVFFIHPTSYLNRAHWNAPLRPDSATEDRTRLYLRGIASAFDGQGQVWAPRYRQATFGAFFTPKPEGEQALGAAYGDVLAAFDTFLAQTAPDAPIVLVGHSQGGLHLKHLLMDRVAGKPLAARVAAAYVLGWPVGLAHDLPAMGLPACARADQPGCVASWLSYAEPAETTMMVGAHARRPALDGSGPGQLPILCTNPLTGTSDGPAPASANQGTMVLDADDRRGSLVPAMVPAHCAAPGVLLIGAAPAMGRYVLPGNNYHVYDVALFWANVRADMARRVAAWRTRM